MRFFSIMSPLFDAAGDGTGGGQPGAGASGQQPTGDTTQQPAQNAGQPGTQQQPQQNSSQPTGQPGSPTDFRYKEDRSDWVPRHRLNEVSAQGTQLKTQVEDLTRRLNLALGGDGTKSDPNEKKAAEVAKAFFALPGMSKLKRFVDLDDAKIEQLLSVPDHVAATQQQEAQRWERHGNQQLDLVSQKVAEAMGSDTLDDDQKADIRVSMRAWLESRAKSELQQAADRYGVEAVQKDQRRFSATVRRYEDGDAKLLDEFVNRYSKSWVEPARRSATARTSTRTRPTPDGSGRQAVSGLQRPAAFKSLDERLDYAAGLAKERGVQFRDSR